MTLELGDTVWIPCEVTSGAFPDERQVRIVTAIGQWAGFVDVRQLREEIASGRTAIRATIVRTSNEEYAARLPGQTTRREYMSVPAGESWLPNPGT